MKDKLVVDTCVFVEGFFGDENNPSSFLLSQLDNINARLVFSQDSIGELLYILKKQGNFLSLDETTIGEILKNAVIMFQKGKSVNTIHRRNRPNTIRINDVNDQMFVDAALEAKATHIITLDKRSGILDLKGVPFKCCTPSEYLAELKTNQVI